MKSPWLWIAGIVIAIWVFSDAPKKNKAQRTVYSSPTFMGYPCTVDCSGHEAGYEWAEENGIVDPDDCGGNSDSFIEGCQAYAEEQQALLGEGTGDE